jgi:hypothetical protein
MFSQSEIVWVKNYEIRSTQLRSLLEDTLKSREIAGLMAEGYKPLMTIESNRTHRLYNDSIHKKDQILVEYTVELHKIDGGIIPAHGKLGVTRFEGMEIILVLYDFNDLLPFPDQTPIKIYSVEETIAMWHAKPFSKIDVCTILWDGKSYYYKNNASNFSR